MKSGGQSHPIHKRETNQFFCSRGRVKARDRGQATLESLFVMFMLFMIIAAIYQMFLIHNAIYQMAANAYHDAFKEARSNNNPNTDFSITSKDLSLTRGSKTIPIIRLFQSAGSFNVTKKLYIGSGTQGHVFSLPDFGTTVQNGNQQGSPPASAGSGCNTTVTDSDGNSQTVAQYQTGWIATHHGQVPPFPHTTSVDSHGNVTYGLTPNCH